MPVLVVRSANADAAVDGAAAADATDAAIATATLLLQLLRLLLLLPRQIELKNHEQ